MKHDRPKISDVARIARVSTATVSRVLSNPGMVSQDTRAAVQAAIEATGYRLNHAARNLRHQRTGGIVALVLWVFVSPMIWYRLSIRYRRKVEYLNPESATVLPLTPFLLAGFVLTLFWLS